MLLMTPVVLLIYIVKSGKHRHFLLKYLYQAKRVRGHVYITMRLRDIDLDD
jgi:hypothetical protein